MVKFRSSQVTFLIFAAIIVACKAQKNLPQNTPPITHEEPQVETSDSIVVAKKIQPPEPIVEVSPVIDSTKLIPTRKDTLMITGVGDMMLGTNFPNESYLPPNHGKDMLRGVQEIFAGSDIVFGNLEGVLLDSGGTQKNCRNPKACYLFRSPEYMADRLKEAGFNLLNVANNHAGDFGAEGRANTSRVLDEVAIHHAGNLSRPYILFKKDGIRYGFAAFAPNKGTPNINDLPAAKATIQHLDSLSDIIIVSFHGGAEGKEYTHVPRSHEYFYGEDRGDVYTFAHAMIDAGADIVLGHGPHVPRAIDVYKKRFIAYSLGNFATYARFNLLDNNGLAPVIKLSVNSRGEFLGGQIISCRQVGRGIPKIDSENKAARLIWELTKKDMPEVKISIDESGFISYLHF